MMQAILLLFQDQRDQGKRPLITEAAHHIPDVCRNDADEPK